MREAAKLRPVVIDESLTDLESLLLAREMGYTGVALKACKGQSPGDADGSGGAEVPDVFVRAGPDLPGRGADPLGGHRAAGDQGVRESRRTRGNACGERAVGVPYPGIFIVKDGAMRTGALNQAGLSAVART